MMTCVSQESYVYMTRRTTAWSNVPSETSYWCNWRKTSEIGNWLPTNYSLGLRARVRACVVHERIPRYSTTHTTTICLHPEPAFPSRVLHFSALVLGVLLHYCLFIL